MELKVQKRSDGKILAVDRETSVAVDITEQTAAKTREQAPRRIELEDRRIGAADARRGAGR